VARQILDRVRRELLIRSQSPRRIRSSSLPVPSISQSLSGIRSIHLINVGASILPSTPPFPSSHPRQPLQRLSSSLTNIETRPHSSLYLPTSVGNMRVTTDQPIPNDSEPTSRRPQRNGAKGKCSELQKLLKLEEDAETYQLLRVPLTPSLANALIIKDTARIFVRESTTTRLEVSLFKTTTARNHHHLLEDVFSFMRRLL
jgi:hypothetical protein